MAGCAEDIDLAEHPVDELQQAATAPKSLTRSLNNAVYNEITGNWMIPQPDPYTLANFQQAYDNLAADKSLQRLSHAEASEFSAAELLEPTHYALRIYPKTEKEQWRVEKMEDVSVVYAPFNYAELTPQEVERVPKNRAEIPSPFEVSPYTVTHDYTDATDGGPTGPVTCQLPVLYVVWPVSKPLPDDLKYEKDYEVYLPNEAPKTRSTKASHVLENEALALALGVEAISARPTTRSSTRSVIIINGYMMTYDNTLGRNVPMGDLVLTCRIGSYAVFSMTDYSNGYFSFSLNQGLASTYLSITVRYEDSLRRWKIVADDGSSTVPTVPYEVIVSADDPDTQKPYWNQVDGRYSYGEIVVEADPYNANTIQRAASHFYAFNGQDIFPKKYSPTGLRIVARKESSSIYAGYFATALYQAPDGSVMWDETYAASRIVIYKHNPNREVIATVLHEIAHAQHFMNVPILYCNSPNFLIESFASYAGWYLAEEYYKSLGWVKPTGRSAITNNDRQSWTKTTNSTFGGVYNYGWYSPLFVDLTDDYNQKTNSTSSYPNDEIKNVPPEVIWNIISTSSDWAQCRAKIMSSVGPPYCTSAQLNEWIVNFDQWVGW